MQIKNLSTGIVQTIDGNDSIDQAIQLMESANIHHLPVTENGTLVGMISDRDLLLSVGGRFSYERAAGDDEHIVGPICAREIMTTPVITISPDASLVEAARQMLENRISACILAEGDKPLGILSKVVVLNQAIASPYFGDTLMDALSNTIDEYMSVNVLTLTPGNTIPEAVKTMNDNLVRHLPIVRDGQVVGLISDRDVRRAIGSESVESGNAGSGGASHLFDATVEAIMTGALLTIEPDETLQAASQLMSEHDIGSLPVIMGDQLVGIITDTDILRVIAGAG